MDDSSGPDDAGTTLDERVRAESAARRERERSRTKQTILAAAIELFREAGLERVSLRQVAAAVGYSATTIYNYFVDKDDLLHHVALDGFTEFGERLQAAYDEGGDASARFRRVTRAYVAYALEHPFHYRLMFMDRGEFLERPAPEGYARPIDSFDVLQRVIRDAIAEGICPDREPEALAMHAWCEVHGVASLAIATPYLPPDAALDFQDVVGETLLRGFASIARDGA